MAYVSEVELLRRLRNIKLGVQKASNISGSVKMCPKGSACYTMPIES